MQRSDVPQEVWDGRRQEAAALRAARDADMRDGPYVQGMLVCVPSWWYKPEAVAELRPHGFRYEQGSYRWTRDARQPHEGRTYGVLAWLKSARAAYRRIWPDWQPSSAAEDMLYPDPAVEVAEQNRRLREGAAAGKSITDVLYEMHQEELCGG